MAPGWNDPRICGWIEPVSGQSRLRSQVGPTGLEQLNSITEEAGKVNRAGRRDEPPVPNGYREPVASHFRRGKGKQVSDRFGQDHRDQGRTERAGVR